MSLQEVLPPCEKSSSPPEAVPAEGCPEYTPPLCFDSPVTGSATCQVQTCPQNPAKDGRLFHSVLPHITLNCVRVTAHDGASETTDIYTPGLVQTQAPERWLL